VDNGFGSKHAYILNEIIDERVIVIDN